MALGRRRRRLYGTAATLLGLGIVGTAIGVSLYRSNRTEVYRTGEEHAEITRNLELHLPDEAPQPELADVTEEAGLAGFRSFSGRRTSQLPEDMGPGAAWGDYDGDGDDDLFVVSSGGPLGGDPADRAPSRLYENRGDGRFRPVDGFPETRIHGMAAAWGDYDGDGRPDLAVTGYDSLLLYRNTGDGFVRSEAIDERPGFWAGASWADFDRDGDLDLYVCGYVRYVPDSAGALRTTQQYGRAVPYTLNPASFVPERNLLFRNDGGRFTEIAASLGVDNPGGRSLAALWHDLDDDGWLDLYVANDISDNALFLNREGSFEDTSHAAWVADYRGAMGLAAADWNRDGDDDLFVTHWIAQENALYDSLLRDLQEDDADAALRFMDVADQRGLGQIALQSVGWGAEFADLDADGWPDLVVVNGSTFENADQPERLQPQPSFLFWNRRGESFHDLGPLVPAFSTPRVSRGLALSDYDNDGDLDLLIVDRDAGVRLLRNEMQRGNWIEFRPPGPGVQLVGRVGDVELRRAANSVSYLSQSSLTIHLGLGEAERLDSLEVRWPDGRRETHSELAANTIWELTPGAPPSASTVAVAAESDRERLTRFWSLQRAAMRAMKVERDCPTAIDRFRQALAIDPGHEDSIYYLANCLAEQEQVDAALEELDRLRRLNPMSHRAHKRWGTLRAIASRGAADLEASVVALERAIEINPEATGALLVLGEVELLRGRPDEARRCLELVVRTNPQADEAFFVLAYLAWREGDVEAARELLTTARDSRQEEWKPEGVVAEGDVKRRMYSEATPLATDFRRWDENVDPQQAFASISLERG